MIFSNFWVVIASLPWMNCSFIFLIEMDSNISPFTSLKDFIQNSILLLHRTFGKVPMIVLSCSKISSRSDKDLMAWIRLYFYILDHYVSTSQTLFWSLKIFCTISPRKYPSYPPQSDKCFLTDVCRGQKKNTKCKSKEIHLIYNCHALIWFCISRPFRDTIQKVQRNTSCDLTTLRF